MEHAQFLAIIGSVIIILLVIIGWFLRRIADRNDALVESMSAVVGLTSSQVDDLFALAVTL